VVSSLSSSFFLALGASFAAASLAEHRRQNVILVVKVATVWSGTSNVASTFTLTENHSF
jgi:hypothetical protein